jgi:predicted AlkP superfamily pyrophosphatase or phosphodiesterase
MADHHAQAAALLAAPALAAGFVAPRYDGWGIANVAPTMLRAFGVADEHPGLNEAVLPPAMLDGVRRIVCLIVDAFGYRQLLHEVERQPDLALGRLMARDDVAFAPLTSVFPSTTVNALTTANTGAQPGEHGVLGYTLWLPEFGAVSEMIRFGPYAGPWFYAQAGIDVTTFQSCPTIFQRVRAEAGVAPYIVSAEAYRGSALSLMQTGGARYVPYLGLSDMVTHIRRLVETPGDDRMLIGAYYGELDAVCHVYGVGTPEHAAEVAMLDAALQRELFARVRRPDTLFILFADHGHINCTPEHTIDLVADHPALLADLVVGPTGEGRARYLHVRDGRREAVRAYLTEHFGAFSIVLDADEAVARGLFGTRPLTPAARARIGDLLLLPRGNWYFHHYLSPQTKPLKIIGRHGGLTPEEMLAPFFALRLG